MNLPSVIGQNLHELLVKPWTLTLPTVIARVSLGALLIHHGSNKVFGGVSGLAGHLASLGWPMATVQAYLASYTEFLGGVCLVVGLFTRLSAVFNVGLFAVIVFVFHGADTFSDKEPGLMFLVLSVIVLLLGPGRVSVDNFLFKKNAAREQA